MAEGKAVAPARVTAAGPIVGVVVHGRGAVITRRIEVEDPLPDGTVDIVIEGITPLADPGSLRVKVPDGARVLVGVNARLSIPTEDTGPGETVDRVESLVRRVDRMSHRHDQLKQRAERLRQFRPSPLGRRDVERDGPVARIEAAMAMSDVVHDTIASIEERMAELSRESEALQRELTGASLEDSQKSSGDRMGSSHPTRTVEIRVGDGAAGPLGALELSYVVPYAAKWWPLYSLRLSDGGASARLTMEALVAQRTGEDWLGVPIGLSTSEIVFDATLPRLPSLRLGKAQRSERRGFREPPEGTERLFEGYDSFMGRREPEASTRKTGQMQAAQPSARAYDEFEARETQFNAAQASFGAAPGAPPMPTAHSPAEPMASGAFMQQQAAPPPQSAARQKSRKMSRSSGSMSLSEETSVDMPVPAQRGGLGGGGYGGESIPSSSDPGDDWLRFDSLVLGAATSPHRGKLRVRRVADESMTSELYDAQESARRMNLVDPAVSRGMFDYRYDSDGTIRLPADGKLHRVSISEEVADSRLEFRCVPVEAPAVYREAELSNPFSSPLLAGPVDVYSEGQLVTTTSIERVDQGGSIRVGLGVDERIRVARNVRMQAESAGLLGGKRELLHDVDIELRSGLGFDAMVIVVDRIPVTRDDHVSVEFQSANPRPREYDQAELGKPIEGGCAWEIELPRGGRKTIEYSYEITLRSKDEIVGGNRRG